MRSLCTDSWRSMALFNKQDQCWVTLSVILCCFCTIAPSALQIKASVSSTIRPPILGSARFGGETRANFRCASSAEIFLRPRSEDKAV